MKPRNPDGTRELIDHRWSWRRPAWHAFARRLKHSDRPILVGPWRGEIGFEALYWTAFVERFIQDYEIPRERIVPISRGGNAVLYGCPTGLEIYAMRSPQQLRVQMRLDVKESGSFKQASVNAFDQAILHDAMDTLATKCHVLHPAWMYHTLSPFWTGRTGIEWLSKRMKYIALPVPPLPDGVTLPKEFVAVRFYARPTFPFHKLTNQFVGATLEELSSQYDVVILDHDLFLDDHRDLTRSATGSRIHHLSDLASVLPENNLALMGAILGRALGFVGTYGGFGQLALRMAKPSVTYYLEWGNFTSLAHRDLADALSVRSGIPAIVLKLAELPMLQSVMPVVQARTPSSPLGLAKLQAEA